MAVARRFEVVVGFVGGGAWRFEVVVGFVGGGAQRFEVVVGFVGDGAVFFVFIFRCERGFDDGDVALLLLLFGLCMGGGLALLDCF